MAGPRRAPKLDIPRPVHPGAAVKGPTGSDIINRILNLKKQEQVSKGVKHDVPTTDILRTAAMGSDDDRALLRQIWDAMPEAQQLEIKRRLVEDMPHAKHPSGLDENGNQVFSSEAQKILDVMEGRGLDAAANEASRAASTGSVPKKSTPGPTQKYEGEDASGSYTPDYDAGSTGAEPGGGTHSKQAAEDAKGPSRLGRNEVKDFDPKEAGVHDPGRGQTRVRDDAHFRVEHNTSIKDGKAVRDVDESKSSIDPADYASIELGKKYEAAMSKRTELFSSLLTARLGSQQKATELMAKASGGDAEAASILSQIKGMVDEQIPPPKKPFPIKDTVATNSEKTPQTQFDNYGMSLIEGNPTTAIYTQRRGKFDHAMAAWQALQTKAGGPKALVPNEVFSSPQQMAEQYVRNMSPELFDRNPVTPSQRMTAQDTVRQLGLSNSDHARQLISIFGDAPLTPEARAAFRDQAIERLATEFQNRFGSKWGDGAQNATPPKAWSEGEDSYSQRNLGKDDPALRPAPLSNEPSVPEGSSTDPASLPEEGGAPNKMGSHQRKSFEQMLTEYMGQKDRLMEKVGSEKRFKEYLDSDEFVATPSQPTKPPDLDSKLDSPKAASVDGFDPEDHGANAPAALEAWKKTQAERGWEVTSNPDGTFISRPKQGEGVEFEGTEAHWKGMDKKQKLEWSYPGGANEWLVDHNARYPMTPDDELAKRDEMISDLSGRLPGLAGAGKSSEIIKKIDALMEGEWSPAVDAQIKALKKELVRAQRADSMTGIQSARKPPLVGKIKGSTSVAGEAVTGNPADTTPVQTTQQKVMAEDDSSVIDGRPDPAATDPAAEAAAPPADPSPATAKAPPPPPTTPTAALGMDGDDVIDPLDSAHPSDIEPDAPATPATESPDADGVANPVEVDAARKVDEAEAPRDAESAKPDIESSKTPDATTNDKTQKKTKDAQPQQSRFPYKAATAGGIGAVAGLFAMNGVGSRINQQAAMGQNATGAGPLGPVMPGGSGPDAGGGGPAVEADPFAMPREMDSAARIRLMQAMQQANSRVPRGTPQTLQQWR